MGLAYRISIAAVIAVGALGGTSAQAQYYGDEVYDDRPLPRRAPYADRYDDRRLPPRRLSGFNCDAVQPGLLHPQPFSCPLPGPRPLGARCFCDTPVAPLSGGNTVAGRVVP